MARVAIDELFLGQQKAEKLQALLRELSPVDSRAVEGKPALSLLNEVMGSITRAISVLEAESRAVVGARVETVDTRSSDEQVSEISSKKRKRSVPRRSGYRRRSDPYTSTKVFAKTMDDAYSWRKYGQKDIFNAKHPRHYFRCTHKYDKSCQATRQVQKNEEGLYEITYLGEHTCMINESKSPPSSMSTFLISFETSKEITINHSKNLDQHPSPVIPLPKQESSIDEEVLSSLTPCSPSSDLLMFNEFPEFDEGTANVLAQFAASTLEQSDVTSGFHEFNPDVFFSDALLINYEIN